MPLFYWPHPGKLAACLWQMDRDCRCARPCVHAGGGELFAKPDWKKSPPVYPAEGYRGYPGRSDAGSSFAAVFVSPRVASIRSERGVYQVIHTLPGFHRSIMVKMQFRHTADVHFLPQAMT